MPYLAALTSVEELTEKGSALSAPDRSPSQGFYDSAKVSDRIVCEGLSSGISYPKIDWGTEVDDLWVRYTYQEYTTRRNESHDPVTLRDASGGWLAYMEMTGAGQFRLVVNGTATATSSSVSYSAALQEFALHLDATGTDRVFTVYIEGTQVASVSTPKGSIGGCQRMEFWYKGALTTNTSYSASYSEIIVADGIDLRGQRLGQNTGYLAGFHGDFTGSIGDLDDPSVSLFSSSAGDRASYDPNGFSGTAGKAIRAIVTSALVEKDPASSLTLAGSVRVGGSDYDKTPLALGSGSSANFFVWDENPSTNAPWLETDLSSLEPGFLTGN